MKKIGILTFHFAYNYGAMLQAFALKKYLSDAFAVHIINYQPQKTMKIYSNNPFIYGFHPRMIINRMRDWPRKRRQTIVFEEFKKRCLGVTGKSFFSVDQLKQCLNQNDINIFGSDQIWNLNITGNTPEYYGALCSKNNYNMVYAGSFGHDSLSEKEKEYIQYLSIYDEVSVREEYAKYILEGVGIDAAHVCDPVFLIEQCVWKNIARKPKGIGKEKYLLYYTLKNDEELISTANDISKRLGIKIISIHPNANRIDIGKQLLGIGPQEFLWLIMNADYICTNSFHASAFSLIFRKKLIHSQLEEGKGRVQSLLDTVSANNTVDENGIQCIDLSETDDNNLLSYINKSKEFLARIR